MSMDLMTPMRLNSNYEVDEKGFASEEETPSSGKNLFDEKPEPFNERDESQLSRKLNSSNINS